MNNFKISINTIEKVKRFVNQASKCEADVDVVCDRFVVDAKSLMGIFSIDLTREMFLHIHETEIAKLEEYKKLFEEFIVE